MSLCRSPRRVNHSPWRVNTHEAPPTRILLAMASCDRFLEFCYGKNPFFIPKISILTSQCPKFVQTFINMKRHSNPYKNLNQISFQQKSPFDPFFIKTSRTTQIHFKLYG
ncbi:hypothetical protein MTR_7g051565 [Medicago truncatula]|uniref:Uncharacterized protein n=1 Tax=Medicago truncatula TaxID=3880 RepID=A0A072U065_MEDTR|nr:hypothetical protein MTR_7g051565 [Medicago truncatula]